MVSRLLFIFIILTRSNLSWAHVPVLLEESPNTSSSYLLKRPYEKSVAIYTRFEGPNDVDIYQFILNEDDISKGSTDILIGTLVPACEPLKDLLIDWVLIGPKQEALPHLPNKDISEKIKLNKEQGALIVTNSSQGAIWHEPYTAHYYFYQKRQSLKLSIPGEYKIFVWPSKATFGDYVFEFGDKEIWGLNDVLYTLWKYPKLLLESEIKTKNCRTSKFN